MLDFRRIFMPNNSMPVFAKSEHWLKNQNFDCFTTKHELLSSKKVQYKARGLRKAHFPSQGHVASVSFSADPFLRPNL